MKAKRRTIEATPSICIREVRAHVLPGEHAVTLRATNGGIEGVQLLWRGTPFGGQRAYFACPHCFAGAEILYAAPFLACRQCHGLAYRSENLSPLWRKNEKLRKLQRQAGIDTSRFPRPMPPKPKWQRWHTYLNLRQAIKAADREFSSAWLGSQRVAWALR